MTSARLESPFLIDALWRGDVAWRRRAILVAAGFLALAISAKLKAPFYPVPMTMQTFVVLAIGLTYGPRLAVATVLSYLAAGAAGLPVFAGTPEAGAGLAYMMGPTGGYLLGFAVAAAAVGALARRGWDRRVGSALAAMAIGDALIFAFGLLWLGSIIGWDKPVLALGLYPFLYGEAFKIVLAAVSAPLIWRLLSARSR